jgi:peptidoglycan/xylan/chitin deacetylase (PgdA/CDA1 family)
MFPLIYHDIVSPGHKPDDVGFPGPLAARYKLSRSLFEEHLTAISALGLEVGTISAHTDTADCALTFDDGGASAMLAASLLEAHGWRGHFFITSGRIGEPGFLGAEEIAELAARRHVIGSHSHSHPTYMGRLDRRALAREWRQSRDELAAVLGEPPVQAAVPGGMLSPAVIEEAAAAGYRVLMTSEPTKRVLRSGEMAVLGRYTIWATTSARQACGYARGHPYWRARLWTEWRLKGVAKRASPRAYDVLRRIRAR